jgi:hypothetical protein
MRIGGGGWKDGGWSTGVANDDRCRSVGLCLNSASSERCVVHGEGWGA